MPRFQATYHCPFYTDHPQSISSQSCYAPASYRRITRPTDKPQHASIRPSKAKLLMSLFTSKNNSRYSLITRVRRILLMNGFQLRRSKVYDVRSSKSLPAARLAAAWPHFCFTKPPKFSVLFIFKYISTFAAQHVSRINAWATPPRSLCEMSKRNEQQLITLFSFLVSFKRCRHINTLAIVHSKNQILADSHARHIVHNKSPLLVDRMSAG